MLKESKVAHTGSSQAKLVFKDLPGPFVDLLQRMLTFSPAKRIKIEEILAHDVVKQFRKPEEETECNK